MTLTLYTAHCDSGTNTFEIRVDDDYAAAEAAKLAEKYGMDIGRLPRVLREGLPGPHTGIDRVLIMKGRSRWSAGGGEIDIYPETSKEWNDEEILAHEAAHVSLDLVVERDSRWLAAQKADGAFISRYARDTRTWGGYDEDVAESFVAYLAARFRPGRISRNWETTIFRTIPNRIAYFDQLLSASDMKPFARTSPRAASLIVYDDSLSMNAGTAVTYDIRLLSPPDAAVTVTPASNDTTAATVSGPLTFSTGNWHIPQTVTVTGVAPGTATISHTTSSTDGDYDDIASANLPDMSAEVKATGTLAVFNLTAPAGPITEGSARDVTISLSGTVAQSLALPALVAVGAGIDGSDYEQMDETGWSVGDTTKTITLQTLDDGEDEPTEVMTVAFQGRGFPDEAQPGTTATVKVLDNDPTVVTLSGSGDIAEGGVKTFAVTLGRALVAGEALSVPLTFGGTAVRGSDYALACSAAANAVCTNLNNGNAAITFTGPSAKAVTLTLTATADSIDESPGETVQIGLGTLDGNSGTGLGGGATGIDRLADFRILEPSARPTVSLSVNRPRAEEGAIVDVTATLSGRLRNDVVIPLAVSQASTADATDYSLLAAAIAIPAGRTSGSVPLSLADDSVDEPPESLVLGPGALPPEVEASTGGTATLEIRDNDPTSVTLSASPGDVLEGGTKTITLALGRQLAAGEALEVPLTIGSGRSGYAYYGLRRQGSYINDYVLKCENPPVGVTCPDLNNSYGASSGLSFAFTFTGPSARSLDLTLAAHADPESRKNIIHEKKVEKVPLTLGSLDETSGTNLGGGAVAIDRLPAFNIRAAAAKRVAWLSVDAGGPSEEQSARAFVTEGGKATATVTLLKAPSKTIAFVLYQPSATAGTATTSVDFTFSRLSNRNGLIEIPAGKKEGSVVIETVDDAEAEGDETIVLKIIRKTGPNYGGVLDTPYDITDDEVVLIVKDNDHDAPTIGITPWLPASEGEQAGFTLRASRAVDADTFVRLDVAETGGGDFVTAGDEGSKQATIPKGARTATFAVDTVDDHVSEATGEVTVTVAADTNDPAAYVPASAPSATVRVTDNDSPGVAVWPTTLSVAAGSEASYGLSLLSAPTGDVTVSVSVASGAAHAETDLGSVTFTPTKWSTPREVTVTGLTEGPASIAHAVTTGDGGDYGTGMTVDPVAVTVMATCDTAILRPTIKGYIAEQADGSPHVTRWKQVLAAFGDQNGHSKMTASQAEQNADDFLAARWNPVVAALRCLENAGTGTSSTSSTDPEIAVTGGSSVTEGGDAVFTVTATPAPTANLDVTLEVADDAAGDFLAQGEEGSHTVTIPANQPSATLTLSTTGDTADEANGSITATVEAGTGYTVAAAPGDAATVAVTDDDATTVTLTTPDATAKENDAADTAEIVLTLGRGLADGESLAVPLLFEGGAPGTLFALACPDPLPAGVTCQDLDGDPQVTFTGPDSGAGATTVTLSLSALDDAGSDGETVTVSIPASSSGNAPILTATGLGGGATGSRTGDGQIAIADNDAPVPDNPVSLSVSDNGAVDEGDPALTVTATLGTANATGQALAIPVQARASGTTAAPADYTLAGTISIADGALSGETDFEAVDDSDVEALESVVVELGSALPSGLSAGAADHVTIEVGDNDAPAHACLAGTVLADVQGFAQETANGDAHVTRWKRALAAFGARNGETAMTVADAQQNADDFWAARWNPVVTAIQCLENAASTDPEIVVTGGGAVTEGGDAVFTVTADPAPSSDLDVTLAVADDAAGDFLATSNEGSHTVTIPANQPSATLTLSTTGDTTDEAGGSVTATVQTGTGYTVAADPGDAATVAVTDDDATTVTLTVPDATATEGDAADSAEIALALGRGLAAGESLAVLLLFEGGAPGTLFALACPDPLPTGVTCQDLDGDPQVTFTGPDSGTSATAVTLSFTALDDDGSDGETVTVSIPASSGGSAPVLAATGLGGGATGSRTGDGQIAIADDDATAAEDCYEDVKPDVKTYALETGNGTAHVTRWERVLAAFGEDNGKTPMTVAEAQQNADDFWAVRWNPVVTALQCLENAGTGTSSTTSTEPEIAVSGGGSVTEGGDAVFTVTADPAPTANLDVTLDIEDDATSDFLDSSDEGPRTVTVPANQPSVTLTLATVNDGADEPDGAVTVTLGAGTGYAVAAAPSNAASIAVADDDTPVVSIAAGNDVTEGSPASFTVTATPAPAAPLTVTLTVGQGGDFAAVGQTGSRQVTVPVAGSATVEVATVNDAADEPDGSVSATVEAGTGYTVGGAATATVGVADDDDPVPDPVTPELRLSAGTAVDEGGNAVFTVHADAAPQSDLTVTVAVEDDATSDFLAPGSEGTQAVVILAGQTSATLTLPTVQDSTDEPDGSVGVTLEAGTGYAVAASPDDAAAVAVTDDDATTVTLTVPDATAAEGDATDRAEIVLTLGRGLVDGESLAVPLLFEGGVPGTLFALACPVPLPAGVTCEDLDGDPQVTFAGPESGTGATEAAVSLSALDDADSDGETVTVSIPASSSGNVPVLAATGLGGGAAGVRTGDGEIAVSDDDAAAVPKGPSLSVNDVTVKEGRYRRVEFTVTLSEASDRYVSFYYRVRESSPVSAKRGVDFWASTGKNFAGMRPGATEHRIIGGMVVDDSHDEDPETFEVVLSDAHGAAIADGVGVATIVNDDPMPAAFLSRFGRTVAEQALDGIAGRIAAPRDPGFEGSFAGHVDLGSLAARGGAGTGEDSVHDVGTAQLVGGHDDTGTTLAEDGHGIGLVPPDGHGPALALLADGGDGSGDGSAGRGSLSGEDLASGHGGFGTEDAEVRSVTLEEAILATGFTATRGTDAAGGSLAFWGRADLSGFDGREGTFSLDGEAATAMLGADYARGRWLAGLMVMQSSGDGGYADAGTGGTRCPQELDADMRSVLCGGAVREGDGDVEASLTSAVPYLAYRASERIRLWGALGRGTGEVTLVPETGGGPLAADLSWSMAAAGLRGEIAAPSGAFPALAVTADALATRTSSEATDGLAASESDTSRLRVGIEGSWNLALGDGGRLRPRLEIGARHDGGDAETGLGIELGGGVSWTDPGLGVSLDLSGRTLVVHDDGDLADRGVSLVVTFDPDPDTNRGPTISMKQDLGGAASGGIDALFAHDPLEDRAEGDASVRRTLEAAWGLPAFGGRFTGSPHAGLSTTGDARDWTLGWRLAPEGERPGTPDLTFGTRAVRREGGDGQATHSVGVEAGIRW